MKVLLIEDDETLNKVLQKAIKKEYPIDGFTSPVKALKILEQNYYDVVVSDIQMPEMDGLTLLGHVRTVSSETEVILITGYGTTEEGVEAIKKGAYDYILKPVDAYHLCSKLRKIDELKTLRQSRFTMIDKLPVVCEDPKMKFVLGLTEKVAQTQTTVMILGETGTGKEVVANYIHLRSHRKDSPFISINCANIQENLFESELFGFEKGAFTGADKSRKGYIELASEGTLFLDEIAEIPLNMQSKFLRFLEERAFYKVGGEKKITADVRLIAATNQPLNKNVKMGAFREDLYYRLNVFEIDIPPLRERPKDIEALTHHFIGKFKGINTRIKSISEDALATLMTYSFPGNARELSNIIERAMIIEKGDSLTLESISYLPFMKKNENTLKSIDDLVHDHIIKILQSVDGDKTKASEILGIDRSTLHRKLKEYGFF